MADGSVELSARPAVALGLWLLATALTLAAAVCVSLALTAQGGPPSGAVDVYTLMFLVLAPLYATVGALIISRAAGNRVGWVILVIGLILAVEDFSGDLTSLAQTAGGHWVPAPEWWNWLSSWAWVPGVVAALAFLPMYFPDGRTLSKRWRPVMWAIAIASGLMLVGYVFSPASVTTSGPSAPFGNPVGIGAIGRLAPAIHGIYVAVLLVGIACGVFTLVQRYRRGSSDERHQIKWFAGAFALFGLMIGSYGAASALVNLSADWLIAAIISVGLAVIPLSVAVAVLRYRLYDIDVVISRALVYGSLAAFITAVYVGIVVGVGTLAGGGGRPNLLLSIVATGVVAVAFQPVRERLQKIANRLVYGNRATPYEVLSQFSERVAESYASDDVLPRMARVLAEGTGAELAAVWVRTGPALRQAAAWPDAGGQGVADEPVPIDGQGLPALPGGTAVAVRHQGELLGALTVNKRVGESLTPIEQKLLDDLSQQAGLVLKNVGLTSELLARLDDLQASRQRLVAAQDEERRRLERNLHDGAQQNLVALKVKLGLAEVLADKDPAKARALLSELKGDADEALDTLRDLARGIYPPLLADKGLPTALEAQARRATLPVVVEADGLRRYGQDIEAAVYFCVLEALQNVQKYAAATRATVRLTENGGTLDFEVTDDGSGFDPATQKRGSGTENMADRLDALDGTLTIWSTPGGGTQVRASLPVPTAAGSS
ncbi:MAG TPA: histidine kinase [Candidatus Solibacter sp.]|jgi:signal transduction histidine kinase|nr:histidine kinase [Candidatus Solibacter sp.]